MMSSINIVYSLSKERELTPEDLAKYSLKYLEEIEQAYEDGGNIALIDFCNDINDFLDKHLEALEVVTKYQKESEYLIGFKQGLLMFQKEFEHILTLKYNEEI